MAPQSPASHRPFTFDTVFDGDRVIAPVKPKRVFTPEEVEAVRAAAFAEGQRSALAHAEADAATAIADVARAMQAAMTYLTDIAHAHRSDSARLALACGRGIADAALDRFPEAPAEAALAALARELNAQPRLMVRARAEEASRLETALNLAADQAGFTGRVVIKPDPALPRAAFVLDWGEGRAAFDPTAAAGRVAEALETALAAEGLHADPSAPSLEI